MKYNPFTKELFTDTGQLIKRMYCLYKIQWEQLSNIDSSTNSKQCSICEHAILDSAFYTDQSLLELVKQAPDTCLKLDFDQHNITLITNGEIIRRR